MVRHLDRPPDTPFRAEYRRAADGSGWMVQTNLEGAAVLGAGRTLEAARQALVAELAARLNTSVPWVSIDDEIDLPQRVARLVASSQTARAKAAEAHHNANRLMSEAVEALLAEGLSIRDAGYVLGVSHARVQQVHNAREEIE